jgi:hypothetical protein
VGAYTPQGKFVAGFPAWLDYYTQAMRFLKGKLPFGGKSMLLG